MPVIAWFLAGGQVQVARLLRFCDTRFAAFKFLNLGAGAKEVIRDVTEALSGEQLDIRKMAELVSQEVLKIDKENVVGELAKLGLEPLSLMNVEHLSCETRKVFDKRLSEYIRRPGYKVLFDDVLRLEGKFAEDRKRRRLELRRTY